MTSMHNLTKPYLLRCKGGLTIVRLQLLRFATILFSFILVTSCYSTVLLDQSYTLLQYRSTRTKLHLATVPFYSIKVTPRYSSATPSKFQVA